MAQFFLTKYIISTGECFEPNYYDGIPESDGIHAYTEDLPTENYIKKHYNAQTGEFYEGATQQDLVDYWTPILQKELQDVYVYLMQRAKASSMQKDLNPEYQNYLEEEYKLKYEVTSGLKVRQNCAELFADEAQNDFPIVLDYQTYCQNVIAMWNSGSIAYDDFVALAGRFRSAVLTAIERANFQLAREIIQLGWNLPQQFGQTEYNSYKQQLLILAQRPE